MNKNSYYCEHVLKRELDCFVLDDSPIEITSGYKTDCPVIRIGVIGNTPDDPQIIYDSLNSLIEKQGLLKKVNMFRHGTLEIVVESASSVLSDGAGHYGVEFARLNGHIYKIISFSESEGSDKNKKVQPAVQRDFDFVHYLNGTPEHYVLIFYKYDVEFSNLVDLLNDELDCPNPSEVVKLIKI